jgi:hypothetical protein
LQVVDVGDDGIGDCGDLRLGTTGVQGDAGVGTAERLERELDDGIDRLLHPRRIVHLDRQPRERVRRGRDKVLLGHR